jgi:hypothetical protein
VTPQADPNGFRSTVVHDPSAQSSSFFSFQPQQQQPQQQQQQQFNGFSQFPTTSSTTPSQFTQFPASSTPFTQFNQFQPQQPQQNRFQQQPFTVFNNNNNQSPRFTDRPSPAVGQTSFTPGSQLQQAFFSVFPQRAQRAIETSDSSSEEESAESKNSYRFPNAEFGGFVPVSKRGQV